MRKRERLIDRYFAEEFNFGGEMKTRGEIILTLQREGHDQRCIDAYLMGLCSRKWLTDTKGAITDES